MKNMNDAEAVRRDHVRKLFKARLFQDRTENGVLLFHQWLQQHHPELLPKGLGDVYEQLKVDLSGLYE